MGAIGHLQVAPGILEKGLLLDLRFKLDQYVNLRPVKLLLGVETPLAGRGPKDIDFVVVRENTEDLYCGVGGYLKKGTPDEAAVQPAVYTRRGCERCIRWAFDYTRQRNSPKKTLTLVAKTNVLTFGHDHLWRRFHLERPRVGRWRDRPEAVHGRSGTRRLRRGSPRPVARAARGSGHR